MPEAYAAASDNEQLPAPARQVGYALRRITGLGDELSMDYLLKGRRQGLINAYLLDHEVETAGWDIIRKARGNLIEPHTGRTVPLGTLEVRGYLRLARFDADEGEEAPEFGLMWPTYGPRDCYGAILYIEKEGFAEQLRAARVQERWDIAIASSNGYSVRAARQALVALAARHQVRVLVAHDFDKQGIGIFDLIRREVPRAVDLGLRFDDIEGLDSEAVSYRTDPTHNLIERGATAKEISFLRETPRSGRRVELNALVGREFIDWLERKLDQVGVGKVVPDGDRLEQAYRRAYKRRLINEGIADIFEAANRDAAAADLPDDLATKGDSGAGGGRRAVVGHGRRRASRGRRLMRGSYHLTATFTSPGWLVHAVYAPSLSGQVTS